MRMRNLVLLFALLCAWTTTSQAQTAKVEIFYETLTDAGRKFFVEQFKLVTDQLLDSIDLHLYPYGRTTKETDNTYTCPFEGAQCEANRVHACLINSEYTSIPEGKSAAGKNLVQSWLKQGKGNKKSTRDVTAPINSKSVSTFVNCFFKNRYAQDNVDDLGGGCLPADTNADWGELLICARDAATSDPLVAELETLTAEVATEIAVDGLVVRINGVVNEAAKTNLYGEICTAIPSTEGICATPTAPTKVKVGVYYEALHSDAGNYITKQLSTYYHVLEDFVDIELVPYGNTQYDADSGNYTCNNDPQCISNKFQALVVDTYIGKPKDGDPISGENRAINFINCLFKSTLTDVFQSLEACSNQKLEADDYRTFLELIKFNDPVAVEAFKSAQTKTELLASNLPRLPLVTVNGALDYNAFDDLVQEACAQYNGPIKAGICTKAKVTVLFEALNHKSRTLFLEQINPVFSNLYNLIDLVLLPAGRSIIAPGQGVVCPGGNEQCNSMKLMACALDYFWNDGNNYTDPIRLEVFQYLLCTTKNKGLLGVMDSHANCAEAYIETDSWFTIHGCFLEGMGTIILEEYVQETHSIIANVVNHAIPIVLINDVEVTDLTTIKAQICGLYDEYHAPDYCTSDAPAKVKVRVYYEAMNELTKYFFVDQFEPWYMYVEEMANIELYPAGNVIETNYTDGTCDNYNADSVCLANKIQAFVIDKYSLHDDDGDHIDGTLRTAEFLGCYFNHANFKDNVYAAAEYCTDEKLASDEWFDLLVTAKSPDGNAIYKTVLDTTAAFKTEVGITAFDQLPWVTLETNSHSKRAADDLLQTICSQYTGDKPPECTPVQVQVYYSARNPQSRRFFLDQLIPTFRKLRERIHLELIPYGVATLGGSVEEECSTKTITCTANRFQACAIEKYFNDEVIDNSVQWDGRNQTLLFIACMFKNVGSKEVNLLAEECLNQNFIIGDEISQCAHQPEGTTILDGMRNKTLAQYESMEHAPWIVINGHRSALAQSALKDAICENIVGDKPAVCNNPWPSKVKVQFHYSGVDSAAQTYVRDELYPHYRLLEEIIDLDVIPFGLTTVIEGGANNYTLICPHGAKECYANQVHACIYGQYFHLDDDPVSDSRDEREYDHKLMVIEYINCYFNSPKYPSKPDEAAMDCVVPIFNDDVSTVHQCVNEGLGIQYMIEFRDQKLSALLPHLTYTPWMTLNGKHSYTVEHHIQRSVCEAFKGSEKPLDCYQIYEQDPKPYVTIHYEVEDIGSKSFFTSVLEPTITSSVANIHLVPFGRSTYNDTVKDCVNSADCTFYLEHACLIKLFYEEHAEKVLQVVACTFGDLMGDENVVNECVDIHLDVTDAWPDIHSCMIGPDGDALLKEHAAATAELHPKISHVPWILINEEHNIEAEVAFTNELCSVYYPTDKPALCTPTALPINIYYETANPRVTSFFLTHLYQYKEYLDEIAAFNFFPYGLTTQSGNQFTCPVSEDQCHGNIIHTCVLNRFFNASSVNGEDVYELNRIRTANFLLCTFFLQGGGDDQASNAEICLDQNFEGDLWRDIHFCATGPEGQQLYAEMGRQTGALSPALTSAPVVTIGGSQNANALFSLMEVICDSYGSVRAPICATLPSHAVKVGVYFSSDAAGQNYFNSQLLQFYAEIAPVLRNGTSEAQLHSIIEPTITAWGNTTYDANNAATPFTCPSGPTECYLNRVFACVAHYHGTEPKATLHKMEFALCVFNQTDVFTSPELVVNRCTNRVWIPDPFVQIDICAKEITTETIEIFLAMRDRTEANFPPLTYFPSVTIENLHNAAAESDLLRSACENYYGYNRPAECDGLEVVTTPFPTTTTQGTGSTAPVTTPAATTVAVTTPVVTTPVAVTTVVTTVAPTTVGGSTVASTTPGGSSGTMPVVSISILLVSLLLARFLH